VFPHIGTRFPLDDVVDALKFVADGRAIGKVVLDVSPSPARA
jgi:NADPH2:quinone reductase